MALSSNKKTIHVPILDARNDYVYAAIYDENYQELASFLLTDYNTLIHQIESGEFVPHEYN